MLEIDADLEANTASVSEIWFNNRMKNTFSTSVFHDGYVYGLDNGILACVDAETGDRMWKGGRYGHGQLLLASGHLLITTERGQLVLVRATPESHQEVAALPAVSGRTWNNPAIAEGILLVRNDREAVAFDIRWAADVAAWQARPPAKTRCRFAQAGLCPFHPLESVRFIRWTLSV